MPRILENEALALAQGIESLPPDQQAQAADVLRRYREQQHDLGEPDWPSQEQAAQESEGRFRALFDDLKNVDNQSPSFTQGLRFSTDPDADRARVAGTAFLSRVYQKQPEEVSRMFPLLRDDYLNKRGQKTGLDDRAFYSFAQGEVKRMTAREKAALEGAKAALRGEDSGKALAAWQAANPETAKEDSGFFSSGFNKAMEEDGDSLPVAANLLSLLESGSFKSKDGKAVSTPFTDEQAAQLGGMVEQLAGMKPRQRKSIYRAMNARIEAAGYDQKGFWAQMLSELDRGLYRASTTLGTQAGVLGDVMEAQANASQRSVDFSMDGGGGFSTPVLSVEEQRQLQRQRDFREQVGNVQAELQDIVAGRLDPVKPTVSWLNDTLETGMIKGPGAVAPFMAASAALGPWGAGILFTADFAEQNRRDLVGMGMDADQARQIGAVAAPAQAAVESLSNLFQLGRFPAVSAALARFTKPVGGASLVGRYVQNSLLAGVTEFTEEQIQDNLIVPASQELLAALNSDMPDVDWSFYKERSIQATPELAATLLPMALVFGGVMTTADAKLSAQMTGNIDALTALNFSQAQATEIVSQKTTEERIAKAASLWRSRAGNKASLEEGAKNLSAKLRELSSDTLKHQQELERRGILPRMLHAQDDSWLLTYNDGSTANFATHGEASKARWNWAEDQLGRMHALTREALTSMERNMSAGRELAVEFKPDARTAQDVVNEGAGMEQVLRRVEQGKALGDVPVEESFDNASAFDQATQDAEGFLSSLQILGSSRNEFKDGILRTTIKLWEGSNVLTLVEEKLEGDAKAILQSSTGRAWMLGVLRNYEQESGDKLFRDVADTGITNDDLAEAWSHLGQSYLVGRSSFGEPLQQNNMRRFSKLLMRAGLAGAINAESTFWQAVVNRAQKLGELKQAGKLGEDLAAELERQLGIDSQVVHEQGAMQEAQQVAQDVAQQVDTSGYSEANPGPNGETFSIQRQHTDAEIAAANDELKTMRDKWKSEGVDSFAYASRGDITLSEIRMPKNMRGQGIGTAKMNELLELAQKYEMRVLLTPSTDYGASSKARLEQFYKRFGFEKNAGRNKDYRTRETMIWRPTPRAIPADASKVVQMPDGARLVGPTTFSIRAFHGTPHKVDKFTTAKIGTGEGAQAYGWGLYMAGEKETATFYRDKLSAMKGDLLIDGKLYNGRRDQLENDIDMLIADAWHDMKHDVKRKAVLLRELRNRSRGAFKEWKQRFKDAIEKAKSDAVQISGTDGNLYTVELLPDESEFLDWDKPLSEQKNPKLDALKKQHRAFLQDPAQRISDKGKNGDSLYHMVTRQKGSEKAASEYLASLGIPGIRYLDGGSRGAGDGTRNYVIFDENLVRILEENGQPVAQETFSLRVTPAQDAEYMAAVEAGDMQTAQRMVDEAAKAAGYDSAKVMHGTSARFNRFDKKKRGQLTESESAKVAFFFTDGPSTAQSYAERSATMAEDKEVKSVLQQAEIAEKRGNWDLYEKLILRAEELEFGEGAPARKAALIRENSHIYQVYLKGDFLTLDAAGNGIISLKNAPDFKKLNGSLVAAINKAKRSGKDGVQILNFDDSMAANEVANHWAVFDPNQIKSADPVTRDESGNVIPLSQRFNPADDRITYSLRPGDFASRVEAMFSPFQRSPEARLVMARVAKDRALRLGNELIDKANVIRTIGSIDREARVRAALAEDKAVQDYLDGLTPAARQTLEWEPSDLKDDPLVSAMLDYGKLMSKTTALQRDKVDLKMGDFDGAPWLPPSFYSKGSGIMPDQMAQALFDAGLLPDAYTDTLWAELGKRIEASRKDKTAHREAVQAFKDAKKAASQKATQEAQAWADNAKKQAGSGKAQRDRIKAWLRVLDGILAAAPPEVRARVGGFVKMAGIATDDAALRYLEDRVAKLDKELDKWLKKEGLKSLDKLFKKAAADYTAGKKAKGKIGPDEHYLLQRAEAASEMDASTLVGELAKLDALATDDNLTAEQQAMAELERGILELVGNIREADAGRIFSAFDALSAIYQRGVMEWKAKQIARREQREAVRSELKADTGKTGTGKERRETEERMATGFGKLKSGWLSVSSFSEVLDFSFGSKSKQKIALVDGERESSNTYEDEQQGIAEELEALFTDMAGTGKVLDGEKLRYDMAQRTIEAGDLKLSQFEAISALLMWRQEDGRRHMEGTVDENNKRTSSWGYDQAWVDEVQKQLSNEGRRFMAWLSVKYANEWAELNPLYRERHGVNLPQHDNYAPILVKPMQAKAGKMVDPVSGAAVSGSILTPGSLRTRSRNAIAEPDFRDALQTFIAHKKQMGYWKAYYDLAVEMQAILGNRELMNAVEAKAGKEAVSVIRKWLDVFAQGGTRDAAAGLALMEGLRAMSNRAATVGLLGRFSTLLVQSTQLAAASVQMPTGAYLKRFGKLLAGQLDWRAAIKSDFIQRRIKTAPPIVRQAFENLANAKTPNEIKRAVRWLGNRLSDADGLFTSGTYAILLDYHRELGAGMGLKGAELEEYAHNEAERRTEEVAQPVRMATRSLAEITSTNPLAKVAFAYASDARQKIALFGWALESGDVARISKTAFFVFGIGGVMSQVLKNLWKEAKGDDDEKMWSAERLGIAALSPITAGIPGMSLLMGDGNMFQSVQWTGNAAEALLKGEGDLRDVNTVLSTLGLFNDTAAGVAALSNAGLDFAKLVENLFSGD